MRAKRIVASAILTAFGFVVACELNPQPLPPEADFKLDGSAPDGGRGFGLEDAAALPTANENDAGMDSGDLDGGEDGGDGGDDAGDGGDAGES